MHSAAVKIVALQEADAAKTKELARLWLELGTKTTLNEVATHSHGYLRIATCWQWIWSGMSVLILSSNVVDLRHRIII
eukprot:SAG11_NODE_15065_length_590_cov_1.048880_2_plen_78_part_00